MRLVRTTLIKLHRWLALALGIPLAVVVVSGGAVVFKPEIDHWLNRDVYAATPGDIGPEAVLTRLDTALPDQRVRMLWFPNKHRPVYKALLVGPGIDYRMLYIDPGTGEVTGSGKARTQLTSWLVRLHTTLLAGHTGRLVVAYGTIVFAFLLISGVYLWWPPRRWFTKAFRVRRKRTLFLYDLHNVTGVATALFLLAMAVSGIAISFPHLAQETANLLAGGGDRSPRGQLETRLARELTLPDDGHGPTIQPWLSRAQAAASAGRPYYIAWPGQDRPFVQVRLQDGYYPEPFGATSRVYLDPASKDVVAVLDPRRMAGPSAYLHRWNYALHTGSIGALPLRVVYVVSTLVCVLIVYTGYVVWWRRSQSRAEQRRKRKRRAASGQ